MSEKKELRQDHRQVTGHMSVSDAVEFHGSVLGDVIVQHGGKLYLRGAVYGTLVVSDGGRVHTFGNITGNLVVDEGAKVVHEGVVGGDAINRGRLYIHEGSVVVGKVKTRGSGQTKVDPKARVNQE